MTARDQFAALHPTVFFVDEQPTPTLTSLLVSNGWLRPDDPIRAVEKPGEGNMNVVVRVRTDRQSLILKQPRPWVQKYPQVAAPMERIAVEAAFYGALAGQATLSAYAPKLIGFDEAHFLLALEDLGAGTDFTYLYQPRQTLHTEALTALTQFLVALHTLPTTDGSAGTFPDNRAMRLLNHEHIFRFPFRTDTGFDLDTVQPGLQVLAAPLRANEALKNRAEQLGETYLQPGPTLLHGDYYPGSWLSTPSGTRVIDPEFGFRGRAEFDLGVMLAHLKLAGQPPVAERHVLTHYIAAHDPALRRAFTGIEIIRRLIGLAQLPLSLGLDDKRALLDEATELVMG
jgi:5-methylthioribose kinase